MSQNRNSWLRNRSLFIRPPAPPPPKKPIVRYVLWNAFKRMLMAFGAMFLFSVIATSYMLGSLLDQQEGPPVYPSQFVLHLPIEGDLPEYHTVINPLSNDELTFSDVIDLIDAARDDKRVKGLMVEMRGSISNLANLQELRDAVKRFRASGRPAYIYASSYGGPGEGMGAYYLASAFDEIWLQKVGVVGIAGMRAEMPFAREALDKIGVEPAIFARKEYKTLFESATNRKMSDASREMMTGLLDDLGGQMVTAIAADRGMSEEALRKLIDRGLFTDKEAMDEHLVTSLGNVLDLKGKISMALTGKPEERLFLKLTQYQPPRHQGNNGNGEGAAALIYLTGEISSAREMGPPRLGQDHMSAEDIADTIMTAAWNDDVKTIVMRIDSPGGSPVASEIIRENLIRAQEKGKKVIVSMGGTCASGGYWIASAADYIFAAPGTLTGSIGVAGGKVVLQELWDKIGINWDSVQFGKNAGMFSFNTPFSESGTAAMNTMMDDVYNDFTQRVAEGRHMTPEQVETIARGRIWSGRQGKERGLVDELGGLGEALNYAAVQLGYADRFGMPLHILPQPKSPITMLRNLMQTQAAIREDLKVLQDVGALTETLRPWRNGYAIYEPMTVK
jgi:protease IV